MKRIAAICALVSLMPSSGLLADTSANGEKAGCVEWIGRYAGTLSAEQTVLGQNERLIVLIQKRSIYLSLQGDVLPGVFEASSEKFRCTSNALGAVLDSGFGGSGKITMRKDGQRTYLKLYGFTNGSGPNKQGFLPSKPTEIEVKWSK